MDIKEKKELIKYYTQYVSSERITKIIKYSQERTRYATIILEDIQQAHNASAAIRSAECFGIQEVNIIEQQFKYSLNQNVARGAGDWLDIKKYNQKNENNTKICFEKLRQDGYKIYATTPHTDDTLIYDLPLDTKVALAFGTEFSGLSNYALENSDGFVKIPIYGFTESFNISVSVSICLYDITRRLRCSDYQWHLSESEILDIQLAWLKHTLNK